MLPPFAGESHVDSVSGQTVTRLTDGVGHHWHLYFTTNCWNADHSGILFTAERSEGVALYLRDLASGEFRQLTDANLTTARISRHPARNAVVGWFDTDLSIRSIDDGSETVIWQQPEGTIVHSCDVTADGAWVVTAVTRDWSASLGKRSGTNTAAERAHIGKDHEARVMAIAADGSGTVRTLHESPHLITHVNASPTLADVITFCHEGPWLEIDQRIWGLRLSGGPPWPIIPHDPDWGIGHEFWCQDGETIGYHARYKEGTWKHAAGFVRFDNSEHFQAEIDVPTHHAHSVAADRMVLDGTRESGNYLMVIERQGDRWSTPRVLCRHDSSRHGHSTHVHPRLRADGKQVCFSSDRNRYTDVYLVDIPDDLTVLPEWPGKPYRYYWE